MLPVQILTHSQDSFSPFIIQKSISHFSACLFHFLRSHCFYLTNHSHTPRRSHQPCTQRCSIKSFSLFYFSHNLKLFATNPEFFVCDFVCHGPADDVFIDHPDKLQFVRLYHLHKSPSSFKPEVNVRYSIVPFCGSSYNNQLLLFQTSLRHHLHAGIVCAVLLSHPVTAPHNRRCLVLIRQLCIYDQSQLS